MLIKPFLRFRLLLLVAVTYCHTAFGQQVPDTAYHFNIVAPAYKQKSGSIILFDEAHGNPVSLKGLYFGFNKLLADDGYLLSSAKTEVSPEVLNKVKIYVTVNAIADPLDWNLPARSAYSDTEIKTLNQWVKEGGSLFLVTDHMPCGGSVKLLAQSFGFQVINGSAKRNDRKPEIFSREQGNLYKSIITEAGGAVINQIRIWGGTAFIAPPDARIFSVLGSEYTIYSPKKVEDMDYPIADTVPHTPGSGFANGAYMKYGKGRIVVFGDGGCLTAQLEGIKSEKRGMNHPDASQNAQFLLNIIHWLDGLLEEE